MKLAAAFVLVFQLSSFSWKVALGHQSFDSQKPFNFQSHFILGQLVLMHCCRCAEITFPVGSSNDAGFCKSLVACFLSEVTF